MKPLIEQTKSEDQCLKDIDKWYKDLPTGIENADALVESLKKDREAEVSGQFKRLYEARDNLHKVEKAITLFAPISRLSRSCVPSSSK